MKYIVKVSRNTITGDIKVSPPMPAPDRVKPYHSGSGRKLKRCTGLVEVLQVYDNKRDAFRAYKFEIEAAERAKLPWDDQKIMVINDLNHLRETYNVSAPVVSRLLNVPQATIYSYTYGLAVPRPRFAIRVKALRNGFDAVMSSVSTLLSEEYSTGNPQMSRGGRAGIWRHSPKVIKSLQHKSTTSSVDG